MAENILTLVISPRDSLLKAGEDRTETFSKIAPQYTYDSNNADPEFESYSQLVPPLVRVTMVAIDEASAVRLADEFDTSPPELIPKGLFENTRNYDKDVVELSEYLNSFRVGDKNITINHKVFSAMVLLRSAKWSDF